MITIENKNYWSEGTNHRYSILILSGSESLQQKFGKMYSVEVLKKQSCVKIANVKF